MKKITILFAMAFVLASCSFCTNKAKEVANTSEDIANETATKAGEIVGGTARSFTDGVGEGIDKSGGSFLKPSESLAQKGLKLGGHSISSNEGSNDNKLSLYFIFDKDFDADITVKVFNKQGVEIGRVKQNVKGKKDDASYFDFIFDTRTNIDPKYTVTVE